MAALTTVLGHPQGVPLRSYFVRLRGEAVMAEIKFEEGLKKLEKIVDDLESGNLSLDEALAKYEEGIKLSKECSRKLEVARKKVEILLKSEDGSVELKPFDEKMTEEEPASPSFPRKRESKKE